MANVRVDDEVKQVLIIEKSKEQIKTKMKVSENQIIKDMLKATGRWENGVVRKAKR